jgi:hypothetical protein
LDSVVDKHSEIKEIRQLLNKIVDSSDEATEDE